jgi:hypothetical protein
MRFTKTFIVRLYFDIDTPERLCGTIHPVEDRENYPFKSQVEFVDVLHRLIRKPPGPQSLQPRLDLEPDE